LKLEFKLGVAEPALASPPGNGGRGLKPGTAGLAVALATGIASRKRGAWIETSVMAMRYATSSGHRLPETGGRGLKRQQSGLWAGLSCRHRLPETGGVD